MRSLITTYESHIAIKVLMFLFFSKWAAGFGCAYHAAVALKAFQMGGLVMAMPSAGMIAFNLFLLMRVLLNSRQSQVLCAA